eukprot:TRINITY_DN29471_c0_g1_i4.p1 TRINITY_DN29471_c0_g1~~TRINITY_DN29471_c0_g1_i4.p1  ORF type:complete len:150 (+),score=22.09 TRINITY_DN29471_c0_g1_i4:147-596(+)
MCIRDSRYTEGTFSEKRYYTIGADFKVITLPLWDNKFKLHIWDIGGQERYRIISPLFYRGTRGIIIVYDITVKESFENVKRWVTQINEMTSDKICFLLVGNKCDLEEKRQVLSLIHISEPTRPLYISYAVFCLKKKKNNTKIIRLCMKQ